MSMAERKKKMIVVNDYKCPKCKNEFEEFTEKKNKDKVKCPKCGTKSERLMGVAAGWLEDFDSVMSRVGRDVKDIDKKYKQGHADTVESIGGTTKNPLKIR